MLGQPDPSSCFVRLSVCAYFYLSNLAVDLSVCLSVSRRVCLSMGMAASFLYLPCCLCTCCCPSIPVSVCLFFCLSVCARMPSVTYMTACVCLPYTSFFQRPSSSRGPVTAVATHRQACLVRRRQRAAHQSTAQLCRCQLG